MTRQVLIAVALFLWVTAALMNGALFFMIGLPLIIILAAVAYFAIDYGEANKEK